MADTAVETTQGDENDDNWLYGESAGDQVGDGDGDKDQQQAKDSAGAADGEEKDQDENDGNEDSHFNDEHFADVDNDDAEQANGDADSQDNGDSDSDDSDDVKVTIGEIKGPQAYASLNIKRGVGLVPSGGQEKPRGATTGNKVSLEDLEGPGSINGVPALEFNIDTIEDKPWNKPGADISDYFNYGFNEVTWSAYCERQRRMRVSEAGVGFHMNSAPRPPAPDIRRPPAPIRNDEIMPPPMSNNFQARENTIEVMTAERREYGRAGHAREVGAAPDYFAPPADHYYPHQHPPYADTWGQPDQSGWTPSDIKELTPGPMGPPQMGPPPSLGPPPVMVPHPAGQHLMQAPPFVAPYRHHPPHGDRDRERDRDRDRERDRDRVRERDDRDRHRRDDDDRERDRDRDRERDRSRSIKPDRSREKSYRRDRSRSRSRRHKSRSRSPRTRDRSRDRERDRSRDRERSVKPKQKDKDKDEEK